ncbi:MAG: sulfatase-like hydrolase/transferase [Chthoniobacter sp.]|nr:sulfatase-like hydrolase/transferase [Chthoniobacter sp.]
MKIPRLLVALFVICFLPATHGAETKPNIVILLADDLRCDGLGSLGHPVVKTPNVDSLVSTGFIFHRAYTMGSMEGAVCLPSRTMLLTGMSMFRAMKAVPRGKAPMAPDTTPETYAFPRAMRVAGYATMHTGKNDNSPSAVTAEFDETSDPGESMACADKAVDFIKRTAGTKPMCLYIAPHEPHDPQYATPDFYAHYKPEEVPLPKAFAPFHPFDNGDIKVRDEMTLPWPRTKENVGRKLARYYASTEYWDAAMGRVIQALRDAGQFENTIFIIAGDNGLSLGEHGLLGKQNLYEFGGMSVPLIVAGKGIPKGETRAMVYLMDVFPTLCELSGTPIPARVEGLSLAPVIHGEKPRVREYLFNAYKTCQRSISDDRWKLIRYPLIDKTQFFDLAHDAHEETDLAGRPENEGKIKELLGKLVELQKQYDDPYPLTVSDPKPAEWSPAQLTPADLAAQAKETEVTFQPPPYLGGGKKKKTPAE